MMSPSTWSRSMKLPRAIAKRFAADVRGVAAVEFAYIAPVIVLMFVGALRRAGRSQPTGASIWRRPWSLISLDARPS